MEDRLYACVWCGRTHTYNEWHNFKPKWVCPSCQCSRIEGLKKCINQKGRSMEQGNEKIFDIIPAVHVTGTQVISEKALFRVTFTEMVTANTEAKERCAIIISIETAKLLQKTLTEHINHWEN